jgi:hypothetical protein
MTTNLQEPQMSENVLKNYRRYVEVSYAGRKLVNTYSLEQTGFWRIKGEDPNCDFGGSHYQPDLGVVEGKLQDIIMYAVNLPSFWTWGAGGDIELIGEVIPKIDASAIAQRAELEAEAAELEQRLKEVKQRLGKK